MAARSAQTDLNGGTTSVTFNDTSSSTTVTTAGGLTTTSVYNKAGDLISVTETGANTATGADTYQYDSLGRVRVTTDATGRQSYVLYDDAGRKTGDISQTGDLVEYLYDKNSRLIGTVRYYNVVSAGDISSLAAASQSLTIDDIRPAASVGDLYAWTIYDSRGRISQEIAGDGSVTRYEYDKRSNLTLTQTYYNRLSTAQVTGFKTNPPTNSVLPSIHASDQTTRTFYDRDGRVVGTLSAEGGLSKLTYDKAGQLIEESVYYNETATNLRVNGSYNQLYNSVAKRATHDASTRYIYDGQGHLRFTLEKSSSNTWRVTETLYFEGTSDFYATGQVRGIVQYENELSNPSNFKFKSVQNGVAALGGNVRETRNVYNNTTGQLAYTVDATGRVTSFEYDIEGRVIKAAAYAGTFDVNTITQDGQDFGLVSSFVAAQASSAQIVRNYYNARGDLIYTVDAEGYVSESIYDAEGRITYQRRYANKLTTSDATTLSQVASANKGAHVETRNEYDNDGRLRYSYDAEGDQDLPLASQQW